MKRFKQYLLDVYLILLDMDDHAKRQMIMEWIIAVFLLVFGSVWGGQWLFMAVVVLLYVIVDIYEYIIYIIQHWTIPFIPTIMIRNFKFNSIFIMYHI